MTTNEAKIQQSDRVEGDPRTLSTRPLRIGSLVFDMPDDQEPLIEEAEIQEVDRIEPARVPTHRRQEAEIQEVDRIEPARVPTHRRQEAEIQEVDRIEPARVPTHRREHWFNYKPTEFESFTYPKDDIGIMKGLLRRPLLVLIRTIPRLDKLSLEARFEGVDNISVPTHRRQEAWFEGVDNTSVPTHRRQEALFERGNVFIDVSDYEEVAAMELALLRIAASRKRRQEKSLSGSLKAWLRLRFESADPEAVILASVGATVLALKAIPKNEGDDGRGPFILLIALGIYAASGIAYKKLGRRLPLRFRRVFEVIVNALGIGAISCFFGLYCIILSFISIGIAVVYLPVICFLGFPK